MNVVKITLFGLFSCKELYEVILDCQGDSLKPVIKVLVRNNLGSFHSQKSWGKVTLEAGFGVMGPLAREVGIGEWSMQGKDTSSFQCAKEQRNLCKVTKPSNWTCRM